LAVDFLLVTRVVLILRKRELKIENEAKIVLIICNGDYSLKLKDVGYRIWEIIVLLLIRMAKLRKD